MNAMLLYKAWLETRARFLISFGGSVLLFSYLVYHAEKDAAPWAGMTYYNYVLNENQSVFALLWVLLVALLMVGGLLREHAAGSLYFTLALPVSRQRCSRSSGTSPATAGSTRPRRCQRRRAAR